MQSRKGLSKVASATVFLFFSSLAVASPENHINFMQDANLAYQNGECTTAVRLYERIKTMPDTSKEDRDLAEYRIAYCLFNTGNYRDAAKGFYAAIQKNPNNTEARLRYGEILYHLGRLDHARIVLTQTQKIASKKTNSTDSWVWEEATEWLQKLHQERKQYSVQLGGGYIFDSNLTQGSTEQSRFAISEGTEGVGPRDFGYSASGLFSATLIQNKKIKLDVSLLTYGRFFNTETQYDYQSLMPMIDTQFAFSDFSNWGISISYLDTRYHYLYYQDYFTITPNITWKWGNSAPWVSAALSIPTTLYMVTNHYVSYAPTGTITLSGNDWKIFGTAAITRHEGQRAIVNLGPNANFIAVSGAPYTTYTSTGFTLGVEKSLLFEIVGSASMNFNSTTFDEEDWSAVPPPPPTVPQATTSRTDEFWSFSFGLSRPILKNSLSANATYTYSLNLPSDYTPVLYSDGTGTNNRYSRNSFQLSFSLNF